MSRAADRFDTDAQQDRQRRQALIDKAFDATVRADAQAMMEKEGNRRLLYLFMQQMGIDRSAFSTNAMQQSHAIGKQEAAAWWINLIREHCPEREAQVRKDGRNAATRLTIDEADENAN